MTLTLKATTVEHCFQRDGIELDAELEYRIPVDDMVELADIERDEVPENLYREKSDVAQVRNVEAAVADDEVKLRI